MKWVILLFLLLIPFPMSGWIRASRQNLKVAGVLVGLLPFMIGPLHLLTAPYSWNLWPGYVKGVEITGLDSLAVAILIATSAQKSKLHFVLPFVLYFLAAVLSTGLSENFQASSFYCWQLIRAGLLYYAVVKLVDRAGTVEAILLGLVIGTVYEAYVAVTQYLHGAIQSSGTFGHQNFLGMVTHFELYPVAALLIGRRGHPIYWIGLAAGLVVVILTASRATIGLAAAGLAVTVCLSLSMRWTSRKGAFAAFGLAFSLVALPLAIYSLDRRSESQKEGSSIERSQFENAAKMMIREHPLGVGANEYVVVANTRGYSDRAGVSWMSSERSANVHNSYLLTTAELGWQGLAGLIVFFAAIGFITLSGIKTYKRYDKAIVLPGLFATVVAIILQINYEWVFLMYHLEYLFAACLGMIGGMLNILARDRRQLTKAAHAVSAADTEDTEIGYLDVAAGDGALTGARNGPVGWLSRNWGIWTTRTARLS